MQVIFFHNGMLSFLIKNKVNKKGRHFRVLIANDEKEQENIGNYLNA